MNERDVKIKTANRIAQYIEKDPRLSLIFLATFRERIIELGTRDPSLGLMLQLGGDPSENPIRYLLEKVALGYEK
jgi:hypothetical protein